jgi:molybdopterin-dependent oxidoreductase alpha subunit
MDGLKIKSYEGPAGGWGSVRSLIGIMRREQVYPVGQLLRQNKAEGFACVSCAWAKPASPHPFEFCENGAKASAWEMSARRATPELFARHTVSEMLGWSDFQLEQQGRLTQPMRYDAASDRYVAVDWAEAFAEIGAELRQLAPKSVVFYSSGRASLETSYMYALMARLYGCNNLPDSSNMCHESTSVGLKSSIGVPVGTIFLEDFATTEAIFFFGQNVGSNSPRMLHQLQEARRRGVPVITFNPLRERGLERFTNPQNPLQMLSGAATEISTQYHTVKAGGDIAAILGLCKALIAWDDQAREQGAAEVLDHAFIARHTQGFEAFAAAARAVTWAALEHESGLQREQIEAAARVYAGAGSVLGVYGMGLTQHRLGVQNVHMLVNLMLLRGNVGKPGAGLCPVRGHSNVQGQRTVGISEKPELVPLDKLAQQYGFEPPRDKGLDTVHTCEGILDGSVHAFIGLGGNFVRAIPDSGRMERAWRGMRLTVQIATRLNRSHLVNGQVAYLLPCLGRSEEDVQAGGPQSVSTEDSTSHIHGSKGTYPPASPHLLSEPRIVAELAKAALPPNPKVNWDDWVSDYAKVRDAIERTYPDQFERFNQRMWTPGGFRGPTRRSRGNGKRHQARPCSTCRRP